MPKVLLPVPNVNESVFRPIVLDIVRQILETTRMEKDTPIYFPGDLERLKQANSAITKDNTPTLLPFTDRVTIDVDENEEQERLLSTAIMKEENRLIFNDPLIGVSMKPIYKPQEVTINFRYRSFDKDRATKWRDTMAAMFSYGRDVIEHRLTYHYVIPEEFILILKEIHRMREAVAPYGEDWNKWFKDHSTTRATKIATLAGTMELDAIAEKQMRVIGYFDFEGVPELGSRENDGESWTISFSYKFKYEKPTECFLGYPLIVHNQLIDAKYRPQGPDLPEFHQRSYSLSSGFLTSFEAGNQLIGVSNGYQIPAFDEWVPNNTIPDTTRIVTALVTVDPNDPLYLFTLTELGTLAFDSDIIDFMKLEIPFMTSVYNSIFNLAIYHNNDLMSESYVRIDSDFKVYSTKLLDLRKVYHVRFSIVDDLSLLSKSALDRLRTNGSVLLKCLSAIGYTGEMPKILANNYVGLDALRKIIDIMTKINLMSNNRANNYGTSYTGSEGISITDASFGSSRGWNTVGVFFVTADRKTD